MNVQYMIYGLYAYGFITTFAVIMLAMLTPAIPFFVARFSKNKAVMMILGKGAKMTFSLGKYFAGGFKTKKHGIYDETSESVLYAYRTPCYLATEYYAHTLPPKYPMVLQALKDEGVDVINFDDYTKTIEQHKDETIKMPNGQTVRLGDFMHKFPAIDDPHIREKEKDAEIILQKKMAGGDLKKWLVLILIGGLVAFIIWKIFMSGDSQTPVEVICKYPDIVNNVAQNMTL